MNQWTGHSINGILDTVSARPSYCSRNKLGKYWSVRPNPNPDGSERSSGLSSKVGRYLAHIVRVLSLARAQSPGTGCFGRCLWSPQQSLREKVALTALQLTLAAPGDRGAGFSQVLSQPRMLFEHRMGIFRIPPYIRVDA